METIGIFTTMAQSTDTNPRIYLLPPHLGDKEWALVQQAMARLYGKLTFDLQ
jgi:hypothetical protein